MEKYRRLRPKGRWLVRAPVWMTLPLYRYVADPDTAVAFVRSLSKIRLARRLAHVMVRFLVCWRLLKLLILNG